jgi:hypothetical protein
MEYPCAAQGFCSVAGQPRVDGCFPQCSGNNRAKSWRWRRQQSSLTMGRNVCSLMASRQLSGWQEQQHLLNIESQIPQMNDLGDAGAADLSQACQIGVILDRFVLQRLFKADGQGHQACDSWQPARRRLEAAKSSPVRPVSHGLRASRASVIRPSPGFLTTVCLKEALAMCLR